MTHTTNPALSGEELATAALAAQHYGCGVSDIKALGYWERHREQAAVQVGMPGLQPVRCYVAGFNTGVAQARAARQARPVDAGVQVATSPADVLTRFAEWKGYPLPPLNSDGNFDKDWLHREFVAFKAGLARAALAQAAPADLTDDLDDDEVAIPADLTEVEYWRRRASAARAIARSFRTRAAVVAIPAPAAVGQVRNDMDRAKVAWFGPMPPHGTNLYTAPAAQAQPAGAGAPSDDEILGIAANVGLKVRTGQGAITFARALLARQGAAPAQAADVRLARAERALLRAGFVDNGAEEWKPPIGPEPRFVAVAAPAHAGVAQAEGWISVDDRLPPADNEDTGREVMVSNSMFVVGDATDGGHGLGIGDYSPEAGWRCYGGDFDFMHIAKVTHYMPTPAPGSVCAATQPSSNTGSEG